MLKEIKEEDFIVSKTDTKGRITYVNKIFMDMAEYSENELLGKAHSIVRHPKMPKAVFKLLWDHIQKKQEVFAYVINKTKGGNAYWVYANVTASLDDNDNIIGYYSVRRKANPDALKLIEPLYEKMVMAESGGDISASMKILEDLLFEKGVSYEEFIISIQH
jgi:PAS domain S-box-containing protein